MKIMYSLIIFQIIRQVLHDLNGQIKVTKVGKSMLFGMTNAGSFSYSQVILMLLG